MTTFTVLEARYVTEGSRTELCWSVRVQPESGEAFTYQEQSSINPGVRYRAFLQAIDLYDEQLVAQKKQLPLDALIGSTGRCTVQQTEDGVTIDYQT